MSVSQLLQPNNYQVYCQTITASNLTPNTNNMVIANDSTEVEVPRRTAVTVMPTNITPNSALSKIRYEINTSYWANLGPGDLTVFNVYRDATLVWSNRLGMLSGTVGFQNQIPLNITFVDEPATTDTLTYSLEIDNQGFTTATSYFNRNSSSQVILTEV